MSTSKQTGMDDAIHLRISQEDKEAFIARCEEYEITYPDMLREMIQAFTNGNLSIRVPKNQVKTLILKGIHHVD